MADAYICDGCGQHFDGRPAPPYMTDAAPVVAFGDRQIAVHIALTYHPHDVTPGLNPPRPALIFCGPGHPAGSGVGQPLDLCPDCRRLALEAIARA